MRTHATYMFDGQDEVAEVSLEDGYGAAIEFRGNDDRDFRRHYVDPTSNARK